jgi:hypothetical protein
MWEDPIIEEVRKIRHELEAECGNDFERIYAHAVEIQKGLRDKLISKPLRPTEEREPVTIERA